MRSTRSKLVIAAVGIVLIPHGMAASEDLEAQMRAMQERMLQLEDRLENTTDQLDTANQRIEEQEQVMEKAGIGDTSSGLSTFLETIEIGGWVSASYFYNFNDPDGRALGGANTGGFAYPFKPDANSFQLDQVWFEIERPVSEESRAGFRLDFVYGKTAELLNAGPESPDGVAGSDEDFELYQAYVQYLAPIGNGVTFQFGKFATVIGAEVAQAPYNLNVTRGNVYNLFQPITHTGILATTEFGGGFTGKLGFVNETRSFPARDIDLNKDKAVLWSLGFAPTETWSTSFNGAYGESDSGQGVDEPAGDRELILDWILSFTPTERFTAYINADYIDSENSRPAGDEFDGYGVAIAGRYALTDRLGLALRGEWVDLDFQDSGSDLEVWGLTTTVDFALTSNLMLRGEVRYDNVNSSSPSDLFFDDSDALFGVGTEDDQVAAGVEVIYTF